MYLCADVGQLWFCITAETILRSLKHLQVDSLPYQCMMVKNKTIIAPKTTEEQKVLFVPPRAGVYQSVLRVCSWPVSADMELAARANIFAQSVVLLAEAQNPMIEVGFYGYDDLTENVRHWSLREHEAS